MANDIYYNTVKEALINDGWTITSDPYVINADEETNYQIDLGADKVVAATKENRKIAVEIKSFLGQSLSYEFHGVLGQFLNYYVHIKNLEPDRKLFLAIPKKAHESLLKRPALINVLKFYNVSVIVFESTSKKIEQWINY